MRLTTTTGTGTATEALAAFPHDAIGWVYAPREAYWLRQTGGALVRMGTAKGRAAREERDATEIDATPSLAEAFELRLFTSAAELRWVHEPGGRGTWHILIDTTDATTGLERLEGPAVPRLFWGRAAEVRDGWTRLADARIGSLWVPVVVDPGFYVSLDVVEYTRTDGHGNTAVAEERCTGLSGRTHDDVTIPTSRPRAPHGEKGRAEQ
ncbi:MAG: CRISPR-associated protein Csx19 [Micrococcales bacterium]|nr:CRISPR-associated protein Csx19 [Micrococcales bacterium]